jgi:hypothetical protein
LEIAMFIDAKYVKLAVASSFFSLCLAACTMTPVPQATASNPPNPPAEPPPTPVPVMSCDASKGQWAVGKTLDDALLAKVMADTGSKQSRVLRPGMMVTAEFLGTRVNIRVDNSKGVLAVTCG